ncbi:hypothetical protein AMAG_10013 [Allomyces macrogynus ATCC 38327]|uniref:Methyltransferase type 11 domain-containing protein n=1 Tax=Allomyces macrogynus (strain ATCC 38327) TaxID=578462 RepID=A0A0L0SQ71_ALLM3|nr:hypothetical protein AMAG_10013 [Allomyces macrogynus ATCC 38327]|eukprot:KNE64657.1 hypothetical protein AMAG_10013 [Allomyces macrogynus ATCC 38327]
MMMIVVHLLVPTAVIKARGTIESNKISNDQAAVIEPAGVPHFDAIFDHTFFCLFPPSWRRLWATRTAALIKPGGMLITLMGPLTMHRGGPQFSASVELYRPLLKDEFDETRKW